MCTVRECLWLVFFHTQSLSDLYREISSPTLSSAARLLMRNGVLFLSPLLGLDSNQRDSVGYWKPASSEQCLQEGRAHSELSGVPWKIFVLLFHRFQSLLHREFFKVLYCESGRHFSGVEWSLLSFRVYFISHLNWWTPTLPFHPGEMLECPWNGHFKM